MEAFKLWVASAEEAAKAGEQASITFKHNSRNTNDCADDFAGEYFGSPSR